jgi:hypothetical protein
VYGNVGVGDVQHPLLACLTMDERLSLSLVKMIDASFTAYNRGHNYGYNYFAGAAFFSPGEGLHIAPRCNAE